ncbi:MAG: glycosyl transferase, partial [Ilumatobacteraceae bacterium]
MSSKRILIISTPVGPLGSGAGGGVELTLHSLVLGLTGRGHAVEV